MCIRDSGNADLRLAEGRRVVNAIAGHGNMFPFRAQLLDMGDLAGGFDLGFHPVQLEFFGHHGSGAAVVASEHDEFQPKLVKCTNSFQGDVYKRQRLRR